MKTLLLRLIVCPECGGNLAAFDYDEPAVSISIPADSSPPEIMEGVLRCCGCSRLYPIIGGVPRLLPDDLRGSLWRYHKAFFERHPEAMATAITDSLPRDAMTEEKQKTHASFSFQRIELEPPDARFAQDWMDHFERRIRPALPEFFAGKLGLDAGCGFGRHLYCASRCGAEIVGIDLSEGVQKAFESNRSDPRVHIVQADLYRMPFRPGTFDFALSFGVLHHLPDPRGGFDCVVRAVRPGGNAFIWVYGYRGMRWSYRLSHFRMLRQLTSRMPRALQYITCALVTAALECLLWAPSRLLRKVKATEKITRRLPAQNNCGQPFAMKMTAVFDRLGTPVTHFHDRDQLISWFQTSQFSSYQVFSEDLRGWQAMGKKATVGEGSNGQSLQIAS